MPNPETPERRDGHNNICAGCSCLCDDMHLKQVGIEAQFETDCPQANLWLSSWRNECSAFIDGNQSDLDNALAAIAIHLQNANAPLLTGLDGVSTQTQMLAANLARKLPARIDTTIVDTGRSSLLAMQQKGKVTSSLGEVRQRSDLVIFWFSDPVSTHPRFLERFTNAKATIIVVDDRVTETAKLAQHFIQINRESVGPLLTQIQKPEPKSTSENLVPMANTIAKELESSTHASFILGTLDLNHSIYNSAFVYEWLAKLNAQMPVNSISLRKDGNALSGENVLSWNFGFPFAIDLAGESPQHNRNEHSTANTILRYEADTVLVCSTNGSRNFAELNRMIQEHPEVCWIVLNESQNKLDSVVPVLIETAFDQGDWVRTDDVLLPVVLPSGDGITANEVLESLLERIA